jgi:hypothetical protein
MAKRTINNAIPAGRIHRKQTSIQQPGEIPAQGVLAFEPQWSNLITLPTSLSTAQTVLDRMKTLLLAGNEQQTLILRDIRGLIHTELQKAKRLGNYTPRTMREIVAEAAAPARVRNIRSDSINHKKRV